MLSALRLCCVVLWCSTRKFFTILFSVCMHGHHLNTVQWGSVLMVFAGLGFEVYEKYQAKARKHKHAA